jgi:hypothetical protein
LIFEKFKSFQEVLDMSGKIKTLKWIVFGLFLIVAVVLINSPLVQAQYWSALPPYNLLWPLWSPVLSPVDAVTGIATPLITELTNNTILPVQPGLVWDPAQQFPWLLYNIPSILGGGITFFDPYYGLNPWPPTYLTDPLTALPISIALPAGFGSLLPPELEDFGPFVTQGNLSFITTYPPSNFGIPLASLLTPAQIWGLPIL